MFKWVDSQNRPMVESIWWQDGRMELLTTGLASVEVGEGWLVFASEPALDLIQRKFGPLLRKSMIVRQYKENGETIEHLAVS